MQIETTNVSQSGYYNDNYTIVAYASRFGGSKRVAKIIATVLRERFFLKVDLINIKKINGQLDLDKYKHVIFGSGIAGDEWTKAGKEFLTQDFSKKKLAIFVTSGNAGTALKEQNREEYLKWQNRYISDVIKPFNLQPISVKAFGGQLPSIGRKLYNTLDDERVVKWAEELGQLLT